MTTDDTVKKALADSQEATERTRKEAAEKLSKGKPTPTQEENDRAALGEHITEHEDDGSGPETRHVEARKPAAAAGYTTRSAQPASRPRTSE